MPAAAVHFRWSPIIAEIYADAPDATSNGTHTTFTTQPVDESSVLEVKMVSGGDNAIWIHPTNQANNLVISERSERTAVASLSVILQVNPLLVSCITLIRTHPFTPR
jgi:hypothetical protein